MAKARIPLDNSGTEQEASAQAVAITGYNVTEKRFKSINVNDSGEIPVSSVGGFTVYESKIITPGASQDGYDVKTTGAMFASVPMSYRSIITNNDTVADITIYLNNDNTNPIVISPLSTFEASNFATSNIFIDTPAGFTVNVEIILFG